MTNFFEIKNHFEQSNSLRLIRSDYGPFAIYFFIEAFKKKNRVSVPMDELSGLLTQFLEEVSTVEEKYEGVSAERLLALWSSEGARFIKIYNIHESDLPVVELSSGTERVLEWFSDLEQHDFVGTESRLLAIFSGLKNLVYETEFDPKVRIKQLRSELVRIDLEILEIKTTGVARRLNPTQIKERFNNLVREARRLVSDFHQVEDNFKAIGKELKERIYGQSQSKAEVLEFLFSCNDDLDQSDQGRSFRTFWEFLQSPSKQDELRSLLARVDRLSEVQTYKEQRADDFYGEPLFKIKNNLLDAGKKVLESTHQISEQLRRLLKQQKGGGDHQMREMIDEVKKLLMNNKQLLKNKKSVYDLNSFPEINLPMERPLWRKQEKTLFVDDGGELLLNQESVVDLEAIRDLIPLYHIDLGELKRRVALLLQEVAQCTLGDIVARFDVEKGIGELIGYMQIAHEGPTHFVIEGEYELLLIKNYKQDQLRIRSPKLIFSRE
ncbi:MAG: DUF3375 domain-containing protein [Oligoflexia bacterium]|nr:DUF3375 domain-containing protein [Oligoflexia bacterium]